MCTYVHATHACTRACNGSCWNPAIARRCLPQRGSVLSRVAGRVLCAHLARRCLHPWGLFARPASRQCARERRGDTTGKTPKNTHLQQRSWGIYGVARYTTRVDACAGSVHCLLSLSLTEQHHTIQFLFAPGYLFCKHHHRSEILDSGLYGSKGMVFAFASNAGRAACVEGVQWCS